MLDQVPPPPPIITVAPPVVNVPVNIPAPVVHDVPASGLTGTIITGIVAIVALFIGAFITRSREHRQWLWERRAELYLKLRATLTSDYDIWQGANEGLRRHKRLPERLGVALLDEITLFGSPAVFNAADEYFRADRTAFDAYDHTFRAQPGSVPSHADLQVRMTEISRAREEARQKLMLLMSAMYDEVQNQPGVFDVRARLAQRSHRKRLTDEGLAYEARKSALRQPGT